MDYSKVIVLTPDDAEAFNNRGLTYDALGDYENAIADFDAALILRPSFAEAYSNRGAVLEMVDDTEGALKDYQLALDTDPRLASAHYNLARLHSKSGDVASCLEHLDQMLQIAPQWVEDASQDEYLKWALDIRNIRENRNP